MIMDQSPTTTKSDFPLSMHNKFTAIGRDTIADSVGETGRYFFTGCVAPCNQWVMPWRRVLRDFHPGRSVWFRQGLDNLMYYHPRLQSMWLCFCGWRWFLQFLFFGSYELPKQRDGYPAALLSFWECALLAEKTQNHAGSYACHVTKSLCLNSTKRHGYIYKCAQGFQGNSYLHDGCQGIKTRAI